MKLHLIPILCLLLVGCIDLPPYLDDNDVLEARQYVVDYDQRMQKANDQIEKCISQAPIAKRELYFEKCSTISYDRYGFIRQGSAISDTEKERYTVYLSLAKTPLSTDTNKWENLNEN